MPLLRVCRHDDLPGGVPPTGLVVLRSPFTCLDRELILALRPVMVGVAADLIVAVVSLGSNRFAFEAVVSGTADSPGDAASLRSPGLPAPSA